MFKDNYSFDAFCGSLHENHQINIWLIGKKLITGELRGAGVSAYITQRYDLKVPVLTAYMGATVATQNFIDKHNKQWKALSLRIDSSRVRSLQSILDENSDFMPIILPQATA